MPWRVLISDGLSSQGRARLVPAAETVEGSDPAGVGGADAWIVRSRTRVDAGALSSGLPRLKVVGRAGTGLDNIDLAAAGRLGIVVVNAPLASVVAVAEHTLALLFASARSIPEAAASMRRGEWSKMDFLGVELSGKTLGLIGLGRIGQAVAQRADSLGMHVLGFDALLPAAEIARRGARPAGLPELLAQSDVVSVHVPLTDDTRHLIGRAELARMKQSGRLICTARGGVIDEAALLEALDGGRLAGAALDVFEHEPPGRNELTSHPRVIATPHIAAQTEEAQARAGADIAEEVLAALEGRPLRWRVA